MLLKGFIYSFLQISIHEKDEAQKKNFIWIKPWNRWEKKSSYFGKKSVLLPWFQNVQTPLPELAELAFELGKLYKK